MFQKTVIAFSLVLSFGSINLPLAADAQQPEKVWRIGYIGNTPPETNPDLAHVWTAFLQGFRDLGYIEGRNLVIESRFAQGVAERFPEFAAELVRLNVDVIVALANPGARAAKAATATIPIVMVNVTDPVGFGLVASFAHPGGNLTGVAENTLELIPKRLELLKAALPAASRIAFVRCLKCRGPFDSIKISALENEWAIAAQSLDLSLIYIDLSGPGDFEDASAGILRAHPDAIFIAPSPIVYGFRKELGNLAIRQKLPMFVFGREQVITGGLLSYGPNLSDTFRKLPVYVDKILKGAKPGDLPVEQPTKFELIINLQTAKALDIVIPPSLIAGADELIE